MKFYRLANTVYIPMFPTNRCPKSEAPPLSSSSCQNGTAAAPTAHTHALLCHVLEQSLCKQYKSLSNMMLNLHRVSIVVWNNVEGISPELLSLRNFAKVHWNTTTPTRLSRAKFAIYKSIYTEIYKSHRGTSYRCTINVPSNWTSQPRSRRITD